MAQHVPLQFDAAGLLRVMPVAQRQDINGFSLTIYSLELYRTGFLIATQTEFAGSARPWPADWTITDDRGGAYRCVDSAGGGGPGALTTWRLDYLCAPAIGPGPARLRLSIAAIRLTLHEPPPELPGPWVFEVALR